MWYNFHLDFLFTFSIVYIVISICTFFICLCQLHSSFSHCVLIDSLSNLRLTLTRDILPVDIADVAKNNIFSSQCGKFQNPKSLLSASRSLSLPLSQSLTLSPSNFRSLFISSSSSHSRSLHSRSHSLHFRSLPLALCTLPVSFSGGLGRSMCSGRSLRSSS